MPLLVLPNFSVDGPRSIPRRGIKSRLLQFGSIYGYIFTIVSYLIGVFIFATIVGQVGNVITNRNANRLEFERLLDGAKTYMRHHKVPGGMKRRVLRWYDYSWSRGRIQGGGDINTALGLLPDKLKTELALHVNLSVLKKVTIFQECQPEFLHDLVLKMKAYIFTPGDSICRKGEVAREMFIIADGILEVLSETGKVLTTMKAGDFFGEIGILNLDGLNKRTADVRSVGYSELFSLSREDVLSAMKDYPDAQEILQTLGRKRLMEVRCVNKKYPKVQCAKETPAYHINQSDSSENSGSKNIVNKLKNDVKGFTSVLRKTRTSRRSDESLEMQQLHNNPPQNGKSMLKRMTRVRSDEKYDSTEDKEGQLDKTPSPIGAGLPLLQRLRLLKEKQDREERAAKPTSLKSPPHSLVTCTLSPQESIQEEPEREVNESSPLFQRLQQIKMKSDFHSNAPNSATISPSLLTNKIGSMLFVNRSGGLINQSTTDQPLTVTPNKPIIKVSFKQRIQQLQSSQIVGQSKVPTIPLENPNSVVPRKDPPNTLNVSTADFNTEVSRTHREISMISNKITKPSIKTASIEPEIDTPIKPWSKLKLATLLSSSYSSLTNCSPDDVDTAFKNYSLGNIADMMPLDNKRDKIDKPCVEFTPVRSTLLSKTIKPMTEFEQTQTFSHRTKFYESVFDLSPEYSGLPFVKRLKILNERQKLAELEKAIQTRSFSLDSSKTNNSIPMSESLFRSHSDNAGISPQFASTYESSSTTSSNTSTSENSKRFLQKIEFLQQDYKSLSPDSIETVERKKLKSILKNVYRNKSQLDDTHQHDSQASDELDIKSILKEPTLEGPPYSVTINSPTEHSNLLKPKTEQRCLSRVLSSSSLTPLSLPEDIATSENDRITFSSNVLTNNSSASSEAFSQIKDKRDSPPTQVPKLEGFPEAQGYFNQIVCGINNVIKTHMNEMHLKFETQFSMMAMEVKRRDALIANLQMKIRNMETKTAMSLKKTNVGKPGQYTDEGPLKSAEKISPGSSAELLFLRGDSLDTVFTTSPPISERCSLSPSTSKHAKHNFYGKSKGLEAWQASRAGTMADVTGNVSNISESVILDIGESSSSSSSIDNLNTEENDDESELNNETRLVHSNDWEVRMLAAEMEKQERKRGRSLSDNFADLKKCNNFLRMRRKFSDTDTEFTETEPENVKSSVRPRASSLDQFNLRYGTGSGIYKSMSIDRDKYKL